MVYTPQNEHFGIVPLEAMAAGRPVIACNSGGPRESVLHDVTGFLCAPLPGNFADAMQRLMVCWKALSLVYVAVHVQAPASKRCMLHDCPVSVIKLDAVASRYSAPGAH